MKNKNGGKIIDKSGKKKGENCIKKRGRKPISAAQRLGGGWGGGMGMGMAISLCSMHVSKCTIYNPVAFI